MDFESIVCYLLDYRGGADRLDRSADVNVPVLASATGEPGPFRVAIAEDEALVSPCLKRRLEA